MTKVQKMKSYLLTLVAVLLMAVLVHSTYSLLTTNVLIQNSGQVTTSVNVNALSGSARDIQSAVDSIRTSGGTVHIPAGSWNFVNVGQPWVTVNVPAGVDIVGAPTQRDTKGQVIQWNTILIMPYEVPTSDPDDMPQWFSYTFDDAHPQRTFRFSDIKMVGWRYFDHASTTLYCGISVRHAGSSYTTAGFQNFRIDHDCFQDIAGQAISFELDMPQHNRRGYSGLIDHNVLNNSYGFPGQTDYAHRTLDYGIALRRWACDVWDPTETVLGHYTQYTVVIEDNFFSKWRHCICNNDGVHDIVRYNVFEACYGSGDVDGHGSYADSSHSYAVGTRAQEIYGNIFRNPDKTWESSPWAINVRGGSGIVYNNTLIGYGDLVNLQNDYGYPLVPHTRVNQTYIWGNTLGGASVVGYNDGTVTLNTHYFLRAPNQTQDGFTYTPYQYPHPLNQ